MVFRVSPCVVLGQAEPWRRLSVLSRPLRRGHVGQAVFPGAAGSLVPAGAALGSAQSSGAAGATGQDLCSPAAVLSAACQELLLSALPV